MTTYDFTEAKWTILIDVWTDSSLTYFHFKSTVCDLGANNEQIWLPPFYH